jgi:hypothetical protein
MIRLPHLETNVTAACQNRCIACNHFVPLQVPMFKASMLTPQQMQRDLDIFKRFVHVDAYGMLGGEPTLNPHLPALVRIAVASGIADTVEVWTNGQTLQQQDEDFWHSLFGHRIVMSVYPGKLTDMQIAQIEHLCKTKQVELHIKDERRHPNFTQLLEKEETHGLATQRKYEACWFKTFSRVLDNGYFYRCCTSPYIPKLLLNLPEGTDGLRVDESLTEQKILDYLYQPQAMNSCHICAGRNTPSAVPIPWSEIKDPAAWLAASRGRQS